MILHFWSKHYPPQDEFSAKKTKKTEKIEFLPLKTQRDAEKEGAPPDTNFTKYF